MNSGDGEVLCAGEANAQALGFLGPNSVVLFDGEPHLQARRLLPPALHGEAIAHHREVVERVAAAEVERWPLGETFALWPRMRAIAMEVILRALFGVRDRSRPRRPRDRRLGSLAISAGPSKASSMHRRAGSEGPVVRHRIWMVSIIRQLHGSSDRCRKDRGATVGEVVLWRGRMRVVWRLSLPL